MRVLVSALGANANQLQELSDALVDRLLSGQLSKLGDCFADLVTHGAYRVQGIHRPLEDDGYFVPANFGHFLLAERQQLLFSQKNRSVDNTAVGRQQANDAQGQRRLTTAAFANQA